MQRRSLLQGAAALPALSYQKILGANDKIHLGVIGLGNNGTGQHLRGLQAVKDKATVTAVCDIYAPRLDRGMTITQAKGYHDYNDLLADKNVDAVIISTPDHWHAKMAIDAMRAGKDVDVEKPMALTIEEAKEMVRVSKETGRILAVDSEHMAHGIWKPAKQAIDNGVLGTLLWSQTSRSRNAREAPWNYTIDGDASPRNLDWDRWIGPSRKVPFDKERFFRWRRFWEYGGGITTDLYYHHITPLIHITGRAFPVRVAAAGGRYVYSEQVLEVADTFMVMMDFANRHTMMVGGSLANSVELPIVVRGHEANIHFLGGSQMRPAYMLIEPEGPFASAVEEKIRKAALEGAWVTRREAAEGPSLEKMRPAQREELIAGLLGEADVKAEYDAAVKKDSSLQSDPAKRLAWFVRIFAARAEKSSSRRMFRIDSPPSESFHENFLRCIRTREQPVLNGELGLRSQVAVNLAVESYRKSRMMFFDPVREVVSETPVAV